MYVGVSSFFKSTYWFDIYANEILTVQLRTSKECG